MEFATGSAAAPFIASYGYRVHNVVRAPVPFVSKGRIIFSALWYLNYWLEYRHSRSEMVRLIEEMKPELIVGDEEFSSVSIALEKGYKHAMITDERELGFARTYVAKKIEGRVLEWFENLQRTVSCLIVPDFGTDEDNIRYVTPVVRDVTMRRDETLALHGLPRDSRLITVSISGSGLGAHLIEAATSAFNRARLDGTTMAVVGGNTRASHEDNVFHLGSVRDNQNLIAASRLVISLAGKSTIDESNSYGVPIIAIPLKNHFEQERNAKILGFSYNDINRLDSLITDAIERPQHPRNYGGSSAAAQVLADIARGAQAA